MSHPQVKLLSKKRINSNFEKFLKFETFLSKLYDILSIQAYSKIIRWNNEGDGIIISDLIKLSKIILPKYYKHQNYASFVRQLNMYGFHKAKEETKNDELEYKSDRFNKKCTKEEIKRITRKKKEESPIDKEEIKNLFSANQYSTKEKEENDMNKGLNYLLMLIDRNFQRQQKLQEEVLELKEKNNELNSKLEMYRINLVEKNETETKMKNFFKTLIHIMGRYKSKNGSSSSNNSYGNLEIISNSENVNIIKKKFSLIDLVYKYLGHLGFSLNNKNSINSINSRLDISKLSNVIISQNIINKGDSFSIFTEGKNIDSNNEIINSQNNFLYDNKNELSLLGFQFGQSPSLGGFLENDSSYSLSYDFFNCNLSH